MADGLLLATAFAEHEPESAAHVLEEMPAEKAALFLERLPPRLAAPVLREMTPGSAARRLGHLPPRQAAEMLEAIGSRGCVAVLRASAPDTRRALIAELPSRLVQHYRRSLAYTLDTVGAWIEYDVPMLPAQRSVADARALLRLRNRADDGLLFLVRAGQVYAGVVQTPALLHAASDAPLSRLVDRRVRAVSDGADVDDVQHLDDWDERSMLPVTAPDGTLLGALSRAGLRRALHSVYPQAPSAQPESLLAHLFLAYLGAGSELLRLLIGRGASAPIARSSDEH